MMIPAATIAEPIGKQTARGPVVVNGMSSPNNPVPSALISSARAVPSQRARRRAVTAPTTPPIPPAAMSSPTAASLNPAVLIRNTTTRAVLPL
jgi:hypothetical protein